VQEGYHEFLHENKNTYGIMNQVWILHTINSCITILQIRNKTFRKPITQYRFNIYLYRFKFFHIQTNSFVGKLNFSLLRKEKFCDQLSDVVIKCKLFLVAKNQVTEVRSVTRYLFFVLAKQESDSRGKS